MYRLWIDDQARDNDVEAWRKPPPDQTDWKIACSSDEAMSIVVNHGIPTFIEFDHDLGVDQNGDKDTSMRFLKWLSDVYPKAVEKIQGYNIHSMNPGGRDDIRAFMNSWIKSISLP